MTSRELVKNTLEFKNYNGRAPRDLWNLAWAEFHHGEALKKIREDYPSDFGGLSVDFAEVSRVEQGVPHEVGTYIDPWGCVFTNIQRGVIGEVKHPLAASFSPNIRSATILPVRAWRVLGYFLEKSSNILP